MRLFRNPFKKKLKATLEAAQKTPETATLDSISQKLQNYTATQGKASFNGASPYSVEELYSSNHSVDSKEEVREPVT